MPFLHLVSIYSKLDFNKYC